MSSSSNSKRRKLQPRQSKQPETGSVHSAGHAVPGRSIPDHGVNQRAGSPIVNVTPPPVVSRTRTNHAIASPTEPMVQVQIGSRGPEIIPLMPDSTEESEVIYQRTATQATHRKDINPVALGTTGESRDREDVPYQRTASPNTQQHGYGVSNSGNMAPQSTRDSSQMNTGMLNQSVNTLGTGISQGSMGQGGIQVSQTPSYTPSVSDNISAHIPVKIKEKIWAGEYVDLGVLLKSAKDLMSDCQLNGDLVIKGGQLTVVKQKQNAITNIHVWTSAYMVFMDVMLEKWPNKGQELLKYMHTVRFAASRGSNTGWVGYDEQYRLRKARFPYTSWRDIDMELWLLYVSSPQLQVQRVDFGGQAIPASAGNNSTQVVVPRWAPNIQKGKGGSFQRGFRACWGFNGGKCQFGSKCKFAHKCSRCFGDHPVSNCQVR